MVTELVVSRILILLACLIRTTTSQVFELDEFNFDQYTKDKDVMLVEYYAPWCHHCQSLQPEWEKAGQALAANREFILGKVDCFGKGESLCKKNHVEMYPLIKLYRHGQFSADYEGERNAAAIIDFLQKAQSQQGQPAAAAAPAAAAPPPAGAWPPPSDAWTQGASFQNTFPGAPSVIPSPPAPPPFPIPRLPPIPPPPPPPPIAPPPPPPPTPVFQPPLPPMLPPASIPNAAPMINQNFENWNNQGNQGMMEPSSLNAFNAFEHQNRPQGNQEFQGNTQNGNFWNPFLTDYWLITTPAARYMSHSNPILPQIRNHYFPGYSNDAPMGTQRFGVAPLKDTISSSQVEYSGKVFKPLDIQTSTSGSANEPHKATLTLPYQLPGSVGAKLESQNDFKTTSFQYNTGKADFGPFKPFPEYKPKVEDGVFKTFPEVRVKPVDEAIKHFPALAKPIINFKPFDYKPMSKFGISGFRANLRTEEPEHPPLEKSHNQLLMQSFTNNPRPLLKPRKPIPQPSAPRTIDHYPVPGSSRQILHFDLGYHPSPADKALLRSSSSATRKHFAFNSPFDLRAHQLLNQRIRPESLPPASSQASRYNSEPHPRPKSPTTTLAVNRSVASRKLTTATGPVVHRIPFPKAAVLHHPMSPNPLIKFYQRPMPLRNLGNSYAAAKALGPLVNLPQTDQALIRTKVSRPFLMRPYSRGPPLVRHFARPVIANRRLNLNMIRPPPIVSPRAPVALKLPQINRPQVGPVRTMPNKRLPSWYRPRISGLQARLPNTRTFKKTEPIPRYGDIWNQIYNFYNKKLINFQKREFIKKFLSHRSLLVPKAPMYHPPMLRANIKTRGPKLIKLQRFLQKPKANASLVVHENDTDDTKPAPSPSHIISPIWDKRQQIPSYSVNKKNEIPEKPTTLTSTWGLLRKRKRMIRKRSRMKRHDRKRGLQDSKKDLDRYRALLRTKRNFRNKKKQDHSSQLAPKGLWFR